MATLEFPSAEAAWKFAEDATSTGWRVQFPDVAQPLTRAAFWVALVSGLVGAGLFGALGFYAERGDVALPRLEPLFAAPLGAPTFLLAIFGGCLFACLGALAMLRPTHPPLADDLDRTVRAEGGKEAELERLLARYGGREKPLDEDFGELVARAHAARRDHPVTALRLAAWAVVVVTAGVILVATSYIWLLAMHYGPGADQHNRIGWTMKNVQRYPADTPAELGEAMPAILGGTPMSVAADPLEAARIAPLAMAMDRIPVYGGPSPVSYGSLAGQQAALIEASPVVVVVSAAEPAYALPAAYAAAHFGVPVVLATPSGRLPELDARPADERRLLLVAAPERLVPDTAVAGMAGYGVVERVAEDDLEAHALRWARERWDDFGWGIDERIHKDGYYNFTLANPDSPGFAAAALPAAWRGNFGPLLYTRAGDLSDRVDQYLWRLGPDFFVIPSDGPFMNVRVAGSVTDVTYPAQARPDLALETHAYRQQVTGLSGLAAIGWAWFFIGAAAAVWALFAMPVRLPETMFYPRLYWPLAMLTLGPVGIAAFFAVYQGRPVCREGPMPRYVRPRWAQAVAATIMGMGVGMALMIASMYLFELNGLPLWTDLAFTRWFWLGAPMAATMWLIMVLPAILVSTLLFMGPMLADMHDADYWSGVRMAIPVVLLSMVTASIGMWLLSWWWMNWKGLMSGEDLWLWVAPLWWAAAMGFLTALIPNYLMVRAGWKSGGM